MHHQNVKMLRIGEVCLRIGLSKSHVRRLIESCGFPSPVPLGPRAVGFVESEVESWLRQRIATRKVA